MTHNVVVCPTLSLDGGNFSFNCGLDSSETRRHLLYWDAMVYAYANDMGLPNFDQLHDLKFLRDSGVLGVENVRVTTEEIGCPHLANPVEMSKASFLFSANTPTEDNPTGQTLLESPISIWPELTRFSQFKLASELNSRGNGTWTVSQSGGNFKFPLNKIDNGRLAEASLYGVLPVPGENTPLEDILEFKQNRRDQLLQFRSAMDEFYLNIISSPDQYRAIRMCTDKLDLALIDLSKCLNESGMQTFFTTLKLYLNNDDNKFLSTLLGMIGANKAGFPMEIGAAVGLGVNTLLTFAGRYFNRTEVVQSNLGDFMYLYEVEKHWPKR